MFTFSEMLALVESESSFGAYVCHRRPGGYRATSDLVVEFHVGEQIKTRGIWGGGGGGRETKTHSRFVTMHADRQRREKTTKNAYSTSVGSAALPRSEASNYTYTKVQRKTTEGTREKTKGISNTSMGQTRERE